MAVIYNSYSALKNGTNTIYPAVSAVKNGTNTYLSSQGIVTPTPKVIWLYRVGNLCSDVTGGWSIYFPARNANAYVVNTSEYLRMYTTWFGGYRNPIGFQTNNTINAAGCNYINFDIWWHFSLNATDSTYRWEAIHASTLTQSTNRQNEVRMTYKLAIPDAWRTTPSKFILSENNTMTSSCTSYGYEFKLYNCYLSEV